MPEETKNESQSPPPEPVKPSVLPKNVLEVLAYTMAYHRRNTATGEQMRDEWQSASVEDRKECREDAEKLAAMLLEVGIKISPSNGARVEKHLEFIKTVPAKVAYTEE